MSAARTLARRFRSQRTDRIRLDGDEVFSKVEMAIDVPSLVEVHVESARADCAEGLGLYAPDASLTMLGTDVGVEPGTGTTADQFSLVLPPDSTAELRCEPSNPTHLVVWNTWIHEGTEHAWTGNSGIMVERLAAPTGATERLRLWCSDGFGGPSFDDLVVVVTTGPD